MTLLSFIYVISRLSPKSFDFCEKFVHQGGKYLLIDEVHKYKEFSSHLKSVYDFFPKLILSKNNANFQFMRTLQQGCQVPQTEKSQNSTKIEPNHVKKSQFFKMLRKGVGNPLPQNFAFLFIPFLYVSGQLGSITFFKNFFNNMTNKQTMAEGLRKIQSFCK